MDFRILGPLEAVDSTGPVDLAGGKQKALLALLLLHADQVVSVDRLVDDLWGEEVPASAPKMVQIHVSLLRKQLPQGLIQTRSPGYRLDLEGHSLDLRSFARLRAEGRDALAADRAEDAARALRAALGLWRGAPLAEFEEPFARLEEARLEEERLTCLEECIDAELALGRHAELVAELDALVRRHPLRERIRGQLMLALYRSGRHAEALEAYQSFRRNLQDELGIDPPPRLRELERLMLQQDRSLELGERETEQTEREPAPAAALDAPTDATPASGGHRPAESRKTVTVLAADVVPGAVPDDPEARRAALRERALLAEERLRQFGASVMPLGEGRVLGVFGVPAARDDDALRAVEAADALRSASLAARIGLSTGEVVTGDPLVSGAPVDDAVQLLERTGRGDVLAAARTWRAVRHAVEASPRGEAWSVEAVDPDAAPLLRRLETPLVGREPELDEIAEAFERAVAEGRPHLVTVFGAPGVGKTRLADECVERLGGLARAAVSRCRVDAGETTYAPLRDVLSALADGDAVVWIRERLGPGAAQLADQLAAAVGLTAEAGRPEDAALAARRLLAGLALEQPVLIVLDDVHWAAPPFLDLVESLLELARAPVLVLCLARPDLLDVRPRWGGGRLSSSAILLDALDAAESEALLDRLSSDEELDAPARERILTVAEGNPLFIEQLLAAALEGDADTLPDSIQTLLTARLDRLDEPDRSAVQAASVCGAAFTTEEVATLAGPDVEASLVRLVRRELIRPGETGDPYAEGWSFRHGLIRDVAYGSIPKRRRAELHEQLAARAGESGGGDDASVGFHLDRALRSRVEAGEQGPEVDALAERAAAHLHRAGLKAFERADMAAASSLLGRAAELVPHDAPERMDLLLELGQALIYTGTWGAGRELLAEVRAAGLERGDPLLVARAQVTDLALLWGETGVAPEQTVREIDAAVSVLERAGDHEALAMAEVARFHAFDRARLPDPEERLLLALEHARRAGSRPVQDHVMGWVCITLPRGTVPVDDAIARTIEIAEASSSVYVHASALGARGLLLAQKGEFDEARALVERTRLTLEELGLRQAVMAHSIAIGEVEVMAGDEAAAERVFRAGFEALSAHLDEHNVVNVAWRLGLLLARQGHDDEAERLARIAEGVPARGLWVDVWSRVVLALVEAHRGASQTARDLVAQARALMVAPPVRESGMHADALIECAEALRVSECEDEAAVLLTEAAGIAERLGYIVARRRAEDARGALPG